MNSQLKLANASADETPERLFQHVQNLQRQINSLAQMSWSMAKRIEALEDADDGPSILVRCTRCRQRKAPGEFHKKSRCCRLCKREEDRRIYRKRSSLMENHTTLERG